MNVGTDDDVQSTIRGYPDAFLATSVMICEGASEVGLIRGLDQYQTAQGGISISAGGVALVDCGGGEADKPFKRATAFHKLGYRVAVLRDDDKKPSAGVEKAFTDLGGTVFSWRQDRALEDELFLSLIDRAVDKMLEFAIELHGDTLVDNHIKSATKNGKTLDAVQMEALFDSLSTETRAILGKASRTKRSGWFKSVSWMEEVAREIVAPDLAAAEAGFSDIIAGVFAWAEHD
jgi:hypothetical protein